MNPQLMVGFSGLFLAVAAILVASGAIVNSVKQLKIDVSEIKDIIQASLVTKDYLNALLAGSNKEHTMLWEEVRALSSRVVTLERAQTKGD